jgi:ribose transport system ATP-binding protein
MLDLSCAANISIAHLATCPARGLMRRQAELDVAERYRRELDIRTPSSATAVGSLSGGNQQKVVLAKWLLRGADVLMVDEPTRGIDVGAKFEIYALLRKLAAGGRAVVVVSSDLPELLVLSHRIAVFSRGRIAGELERAEFDEERILQLAYRHYVSERPTSEVKA